MRQLHELLIMNSNRTITNLMKLLSFFFGLKMNVLNLLANSPSPQMFSKELVVFFGIVSVPFKGCLHPFT